VSPSNASISAEAPRRRHGFESPSGTDHECIRVRRTTDAAAPRAVAAPGGGNLCLTNHMIPETGGAVANVPILAGKWGERVAAREGVS
jgi:hypothetical protein